MNKLKVMLEPEVDKIRVSVFKETGKFYANSENNLKPEHAELHGFELADLIKSNDPSVQGYSPMAHGFGRSDIYYVIDVDYVGQNFCTFLMGGKQMTTKQNMSNSDAEDFARQTESYVEENNPGPFAPSNESEPVEVRRKSDDLKSKIGMVCQYSEYGPGFKPVARTIKSLPNGSYDIRADQNGIFVVPSIPMSGLLLELPEMRSEEIITLIENFWNSEKDYKEGNEFVHGGAAYKGGILVYGPAGTGKSCTIKLVSKKLIQRGGCVFFADCHPEYVMGFLMDFSRVEKDRKCIVILEDIDSMITRYGEAYYLQILDSAKSIDNVMFIATTNYPERLDPRIYNRPGRFSHVVKVGLPVAGAREAFLKAILKDYRDVPYIVDNTDQFSIDHLSALVNSVYREKKNLADEIKRLRVLFKVPKAEEAKPIGLSADR